MNTLRVAVNVPYSRVISPHEEAVDGPAQGCSNGKEVSPRRQLYPGPFKDHEPHSEKGQQRSSDEWPPDMDPLQVVSESPLPYPAVKKSQDRSPQRGSSHQEGGVAGLGIHEGRVFRQEIQRTAGDTEKKEYSLILPPVPDPARFPGYQSIDPDASVCQDEAAEEDGCRSHSCADKHLGTHEGDAPDGYNQERTANDRAIS